MGATLNIRKAPEPDPVFDPDDHYAEVHTSEGVRYLQTKYIFTKQGKFMAIAPENMWMAPLTSEQRRNLDLQRQKNKRFFHGGKTNVREAGIPQQVIDAERENAKARAAESAAA